MKLENTNYKTLKDTELYTHTEKELRIKIRQSALTGFKYRSGTGKKKALFGGGELQRPNYYQVY